MQTDEEETHILNVCIGRTGHDWYILAMVDGEVVERSGPYRSEGDAVDAAESLHLRLLESDIGFTQATVH